MKKSKKTHKMQKLLVWIVTLGFPFLAFLMLGRMFRAVVALVLQATIIGWLPAAIWARTTWVQDMSDEEPEPAKSTVNKEKKNQPAETEMDETSEVLEKLEEPKASDEKTS